MTLVSIISRNKKISSALVADMKGSFAVSRTLERQSLDLKRKLVKERKIAYAALAARGRGDGAAGGVGGGLLGGALGIRGLRMARRFLGGGGGLVTGGGGPKFPRLPGRGPKITGGGRFRLPRLGGGTRITGGANALRGTPRVGPLAVALTALDFGSRLGEGQNLTQATVGAGGGLAGALAGGAAGAKIGATIGTFFGPGIGTAIGGAIGFAGGSIIGGMAGSGIADFFTGANRRREFETKRTVAIGAKTSFSEALDKFDRVLDKFAKFGRSGILLGFRDEVDDEVGPDIGDILPVGRRKPRWRGWVDNIGYTALGVGLATLAVIGLVNIFDGPLSETALGLAARQAFLKAPWLKRLSFIKPKTIKFYSRPPVTVSGNKTLSDFVLEANRKIIKKYPNTKLQPMESLTNQALKNSSVRTRVQLENSMNPLRQRGNGEDVIKRILEAGKKVGEYADFWGTPTIPGKQDGGEVSVGEPVVIGEIEPEIFIPGQDGVIVPGSGGQKVLVINNEGKTIRVPIGGGGGGGDTATPVLATPDVYTSLAKYAQFTSLLTV